MSQFIENNAKKLISLTDHNKRKGGLKLANGIACPQCGEELFDNDNMIFEVDRREMKVYCNNCSYTGIRLI